MNSPSPAARKVARYRVSPVVACPHMEGIRRSCEVSSFKLSGKGRPRRGSSALGMRCNLPPQAFPVADAIGFGLFADSVDLTRRPGGQSESSYLAIRAHGMESPGWVPALRGIGHRADCRRLFVGRDKKWPATLRWRSIRSVATAG